jgi:RNA polymerase sigma factor (sigma-70 family)
MRSVRNGAIDSIRQARKQTGSHPREPGGIAKPDRRKIGPLTRKEPDESDEQFHAILSEAIATLSQSDREVLELAYLRTMTREERAAELNKTLGAYDKQLHDARERLKKAVEDARTRRTSVT